jgi:hypothetical protein
MVSTPRRSVTAAPDRERPRAFLLGPVPDTNFVRAHPQHPRQCHPQIGLVPHQRLGPARLARRTISVKEPLNSNYISISLWGVLRGPTLGGLGPLRPDRSFSLPSHISYRSVKPARVSAALVRCGLRREADVPQVSSCDQM